MMMMTIIIIIIIIAIIIKPAYFATFLNIMEYIILVPECILFNKIF
jgi:hypothetical protein